MTTVRLRFGRGVLLGAVAVCAALALPGCGGGDGPKVHTLTGPVTLDGKPIEEGQITFTRTGDSKAFSGTIKDGKYEIKVEEGDMKVSIIASRPIPGKFDTTSNPGTKEQMYEMYVPKKYNSDTTLTAKVDSGTKSIPFELTSK